MQIISSSGSGVGILSEVGDFSVIGVLAVVGVFPWSVSSPTTLNSACHYKIEY